MELPTYTSIWRIEKRLYKLYDFRLPMPLPVGQLAVFAAITVPYIVLLTLFGLPFNHSLFWLYVLPPGLLTWLATRPVLESKRLPELIISQARYLAEPTSWCRMAPNEEAEEFIVVGRVWRQAPASAEAAMAAESSPRQQPAASPAATAPVAAGAAASVSAAAATAAGTRARAAPVMGTPAAGVPAIGAQAVAAQAVGAQAVGAPPVRPDVAAGPPPVGADAASAAAAGGHPAGMQAPVAEAGAGTATAGQADGTRGGRLQWPAPAHPVHLPQPVRPAAAERAATEQAATDRSGAGQANAVRESQRAAEGGHWPTGHGPERESHHPARHTGPSVPWRPRWPAAPDDGLVTPALAPKPQDPCPPAQQPAATASPAAPAGSPPPPIAAGTAPPAPLPPITLPPLTPLPQAAPLSASAASAAPPAEVVTAAQGSPEPAPAQASQPSAAAPAAATTPAAETPSAETASTVEPPAAQAPSAVQMPDAKDVPAAGGTPAAEAPSAVKPPAAQTLSAVGTPTAETFPAVQMPDVKDAPAAVATPGDMVATPGDMVATPKDVAAPPAESPAAAPPPTAAPPPAPSVMVVPAQRSLAGASQAPLAPPRPAPTVERALGGPTDQRVPGWRSHVTVVPGGRGPGRPDPEAEARARAMLPLDGPRLTAVLGCTVGAGQTVTALMLASLLAELRGEPVAALDLNPGPASLSDLARFPAVGVSTLLAGGPGPGTHTGYAPAAAHRMTPRTGRGRGRLDIVCADTTDSDPLATDGIPYGRLFALLPSRYALTFADPGAAAVASVLSAADQLVLVAPASPDAARAVGMTLEWLGGNGFATLRARSVMVLNGVSQRSQPHAQQAEAVVSGRCRAIVRVPWDDHLAEPATEQGIRESIETAGTAPPPVAQLRPAVRQAYIALAGVVVSTMADTAQQQRVAR